MASAAMNPSTQLQNRGVIDLSVDDSTPSPVDFLEQVLVDDEEMAAIEAALEAASARGASGDGFGRTDGPKNVRAGAERAAGGSKASESVAFQEPSVPQQQRKRRVVDRVDKVARARAKLSQSNSSFLASLDRLRRAAGRESIPRATAAHARDARGNSADEGSDCTCAPRTGAPGVQPEEKLDAQQHAVLDACLQGKNVFVTGMGGTGKTYLLRHIVAALKRMHGPHAVACCAPTGVAAILCGGQTLHSLAGCGVANTAQDFGKLWKDANKKRWRGLKVLVVDEISMVEPSFLDFLDTHVRLVRGAGEAAFGGLQVVLSGDFCQLAGITKGLSLRDVHLIPKGAELKEGNIPISRIGELAGAAFQTNCWRQLGLTYFVLDKVHRQSEEAFVRFLTQVRANALDNESTALLRSLARPLATEAAAAAGCEDVGQGVVATRLYARNRDVDRENRAKLSALSGPSMLYRAVDSVRSLFLHGAHAGGRGRCATHTHDARDRM